MITYLYWVFVALIAISALVVLIKSGKVKAGLGMASAIVLIAWFAYFFHFQQLFVKRLGGVMTVTVAPDSIHLGSTWKDDNLWIESYVPKTKECVFQEYSRGNLLQGRVLIKNCQPLLLNQHRLESSSIQ